MSLTSLLLFEEEEHEEQHEEDEDEVVRPKKDEKTAEVFGDELADLSDDDSNKEEADNLRASQNVRRQLETARETSHWSSCFKTPFNFSCSARGPGRGRARTSH